MKTIFKTLLAGALLLAAGTVRADWYVIGLDGTFDEYDHSRPMTPEGATAYLLELPSLAPGQSFKIISEKGYAESYGNKDRNTPFEFEKDWTLIKGTDSRSIHVPFKIYNVKIYFHPAKSDIYVTGDPETIYMFGNWGQEGTRWDKSSGVELKYMEDQPDTWYGTVHFNNSGSSSLNYFRFLRLGDELGPNDTNDHEKVTADTPWDTRMRKKTGSDRSFTFDREGDYYITYSKVDDESARFTLSPRPTVVCRLSNAEGAWSKDGMEFPGVVCLDSRGVGIDGEKIAVYLQPGTSDEGDWLTGDGRPDGLFDPEWEEWQAIERSGQLVDGYWDPSKVSASLADEDDYGIFPVKATLPCSGKYRMTIGSEDYNLIYPPGQEEEAFLSVYPSLRNLWVMDDLRNEEGEYIPLCANIEGISMNTSDSYDDFNGWYMAYPFMKTEETDEDNPVIFNYDSLHKSVFYTPGIYFARIWTRVATTSAEPAKWDSRPRRINDAQADGYTPGRILDLSEMSPDGTSVGSNYLVSVILSKNGATTPLSNNGDSEEAFIVSPNPQAPVPTGITTVGSDTGSTPVYYNLQGQRVYSPSRGIFIKVEGKTASKVAIP